VHGIGTQKRGDVLRQWAFASVSGSGFGGLVDAEAKTIEPKEITQQNLDHVRIRQGSHQIRLYEVYWADLMPDADVDGIFSDSDFEETTWFPLLNWRAGLLPKDEYPLPLVVLFRTFELWLLQVVMSLGLQFQERLGSKQIQNVL
jgi:hypothetical protein